MEARNPNKRLRQNPGRLTSSTIQNQNQNPNVPDFSQNLVDVLVSWFFSLPDLNLSSIGCSFDQALEKLSETSRDDSFPDHALELTSLLHESAKRNYRKQAKLHNSKSWPLLPELTIEVFSRLDTQSLMQASASCTMFRNCAMDPYCYSHIDLTTTSSKYADDGLVSTMIHRAGKKLRSIKLGCPDRYTSSSLTKHCLVPLSYNDSSRGRLLTNLHVYHLTKFDYYSLSDVFLSCPNLTNLKIVGLYGEIDDALELLPRKCEHLYIEKRQGSPRFRYNSFGRNHPNLTSLSFIGFDINDESANFFIRDIPKLKYMNLSGSSGINGSFLRDIKHEDTLLETIILRDCYSLKETNVCRFMDALIEGHFRYIRHMDISIEEGLLYEGRRCTKPKLPLEDLKEERPGLTFVADFTSPPSYSRSSYIIPSSPGYNSHSDGSFSDGSYY